MTRPGYKMTEIGEIPKEWTSETLDSCCDLIKDGTHTPPKRKQKGVPLLSAVNVNSGHIDFENNVTYISEEDYAKIHKSIPIESGDVLMTIVGTLGRSAIVKTDLKFTVQRSVSILRPSREKLNVSYFFYSLNSERTIKQLLLHSKATAQSGIYLGDISKITVAYPPSQEQQKIAEILTTADRKIELIDKEIQAAEKLKKGLMQTLLTRGIGHTKFKMTEIGEIPENWDIKKLSEVSECRREIIEPLKNKSKVYIGLENITPGKIKISTFGNSTVLKSSKFKFYKSDILYGKLRPYLDKVAVAEQDGICSTDIIPIIGKQIDSYFLVYQLHSNLFLQFAISTISGTNHPRTSWEEISHFSIPCPPLPEQQKISEILTTADRKIELLNRKKKQAERLKKGLMQILLTGQVRVKIDPSRAEN